MTTEVVVMNNLAVALAADSAITTHTREGPKIYFTANKIFSLSKYSPIGIMVYDSAEFISLPWETIIKVYREYLGSKSFSKVTDYVDHFLKFIVSSTELFSSEAEQLTIKNQAAVLFIKIWEDYEETLLDVQKASIDISLTESKKGFTRFLAERIEAARKEKYLSGFNRQAIQALLRQYQEPIHAAAKEGWIKGYTTPRMRQRLSTLFAEMYCRNWG